MPDEKARLVWFTGRSETTGTEAYFGFFEEGETDYAFDYAATGEQNADRGPRDSGAFDDELWSLVFYRAEGLADTSSYELEYYDSGDSRPRRRDTGDTPDTLLGRIMLDDLPIEGFAVGGGGHSLYEVAGDFLRITEPGAEPMVIALDGVSVTEDGVPSEPTVGTDAAEMAALSWTDDTHDAGGGDDEVDALDGNDSVAGGEGSDTIDGGAGDDVIYGDAAPAEWGFA